MLLYTKKHKKWFKEVSSIYLHGTEAVLDESLDPIVLGLLQNLIQLSVVLWKWHWAISQEVQNQSKVSATPIQNYPTWDSRKNDSDSFALFSNLCHFPWCVCAVGVVLAAQLTNFEHPVISCGKSF